MIFSAKAKEEFDVKTITSRQMEEFVNMCSRIYSGTPDWLDKDEHIKTVNFAKSICEETAKLTTLGIKITIDGSARAIWLQEQIDKIFYQLRSWVEYGCAYGTICLKPNGTSIDMVLPTDFMITDVQNKKIIGIIFLNKESSFDNKTFYTRLEYHRFIDGTYVITNKCYVSTSENDIGKPINIKETPWSELSEEQYISELTAPLYSILVMPTANNIDVNSALGMPRFSEAIQELKDLDIAYSRNATEIYDSKRTVLMDSDKLIVTRGENVLSVDAWERAKKNMHLPDYVRNVMGNGTDDYYQEINPTLNTEMRLNGINALLSQIGFKCGFSNGYFVFNEKTGMVTATQVESDDRRTIQTIKDIRDSLESCLTDLIYALDKFADLYSLAPLGVYECVFDFGDITYSFDEDKKTWWSYVQSGKMPFWRYLVKFEGMTEEEAHAIQDETDVSEKESLFGAE